MTYQQFIKTLEHIALTQHNIRYAGYGDLYRDLDSNPSLKYGVFYLTPNQHQLQGDTVLFSVNAFVIDRLINEEGDNTLQVQSSAKEVLDNIFRVFCERYGADIYGSVIYQMFTQKFSDLTAGCYAIITFALPVDTICVDE